jgi:hypothetical protein
MLWVKTQTVKNAAPKGRVLKTTRFCQIRDIMRGRLGDDHNKGRRTFTVWHARALKPEPDATVVSYVRERHRAAGGSVQVAAQVAEVRSPRSAARRLELRRASGSRQADVWVLPVHNELASHAAQRAQITTRLSGREASGTLSADRLELRLRPG